MLGGMMEDKALNEKDVRRIVREEVAPIRRRVADKRLRKLIADEVEPMHERITQTERDIALLMVGYQATKDTINERFGRLEDKLDAQHGEMLARLGQAEGWITRRTGIEKSIVRLGGAAVVAVAKRWLPFVALVVGVLGFAYVVLMIVEG